MMKASQKISILALIILGIGAQALAANKALTAYKCYVYTQSGPTIGFYQIKQNTNIEAQVAKIGVGNVRGIMVPVSKVVECVTAKQRFTNKSALTWDMKTPR